jgi:hypothetical protein
MTDELEHSIAHALSNGNSGTADLIELICAVEKEAVAATVAAVAARDQATDLLAAPDAKAAHEAVIVAELRRDRLRAVQPRLQERLAHARAAEYCERWVADYQRVAAQRDALAQELADTYPVLVRQLCDLFQRLSSCDREVARVNSAAPGSEARRLRGAELVARGLEAFSQDRPSISERLQLPDPNNSAALVWPVAQQSLGVAMAESMVAASGNYDPRRFTNRWWEVQEEDTKQRQVASQQLADWYQQQTEAQEARQNREERQRHR